MRMKMIKIQRVKKVRKVYPCKILLGLYAFIFMGMI